MNGCENATTTRSSQTSESFSSEPPEGTNLSSTCLSLKLKATLIEFFQKNKVHSTVEPHRILQFCEDLEENFTHEELCVSVDTFRRSLEGKDLDVSSPLKFTQFWEDLVKHALYSFTVLDVLHVDTILHLVFDCLRSPNSVELYDDYPATPPASAKALFATMQRESNSLLSDSDIESSYQSLNTKEKLHLISLWKKQMVSYTEELDNFLSVHHDLLKTHRLYVCMLRDKAVRGVEQITLMAKRLANSESKNKDARGKYFSSFREAVLEQFKDVSVSEREQHIEELFHNTDPRVISAMMTLKKEDKS